MATLHDVDPLDGAGWRRTILDYAAPDSRARAAQLARMRNWAAPSWDDHFAAVDGLLAQAAARSAVTIASPARRIDRPVLTAPLPASPVPAE